MYSTILFRNLETRFRRRWDRNAMNLEEIIWGSAEWVYMALKKETSSGM
jgi:hypothetical protein